MGAWPTVLVAAAMAGPAAAIDPVLPTVASWSQLLGPPSKSVAASNRVRAEDEPLLIYWFSVQAAPLGIGPMLPGTLVANFAVTSPLHDSPLQDFTFLAVADPRQTADLVAALHQQGWVSGAQTQARAGGTFQDLTLVLPDGRTGTVSLRHEETAAALADGRPAPSLWMHVGSN